MIKFLSMILILSLNHFAQQNQPSTVNSVDINKYTGLWYEIAKIPNRFQKQCISGTTAQYTLREDGQIDVVNSCIEADGSIDRAEGLARIVDDNSNAKLEVSFFSILGWRPVWGDYWIIGLDENYQWVVVGTPNRKYGWILSRTPQLDIKKMEELFQILKDQGYDPGDFEISKQ